MAAFDLTYLTSIQDSDSFIFSCKSWLISRSVMAALWPRSLTWRSLIQCRSMPSNIVRASKKKLKSTAELFLRSITNIRHGDNKVSGEKSCRSWTLASLSESRHSVNLSLKFTRERFVVHSSIKQLASSG